MHAHYLQRSIEAESRKDSIERGKSFLKTKGIKDCDTIAVRGVSGITIGSVVAYLRKKGLAVVRKDLANNHSGNRVESPDDVSKYVIVDDFVSSGETVYRIVAAMKRAHPTSECIGIYLYGRKEQPYTSAALVNELLANYRGTYPELAKQIDEEKQNNV